MKKLVILLIIVVVALAGYIFLQNNGIKTDSIINIPNTIDLTVNCSSVNNLLITSEVTVDVANNSSRTHHDVTVRVTGYDKNGNITKEKVTTFDRTLEPNASFSLSLIHI